MTQHAFDGASHGVDGHRHRAASDRRPRPQTPLEAGAGKFEHMDRDELIRYIEFLEHTLRLTLPHTEETHATDWSIRLMQVGIRADR